MPSDPTTPAAPSPSSQVAESGRNQSGRNNCGSQVSINPTGDSLQVSAPVPLFQARVAAADEPGNYNVSPDGRFLITVPSSEQVSTPIQIIVNWKGKQ
jgi:hypothetical protein